MARAAWTVLGGWLCACGVAGSDLGKEGSNDTDSGPPAVGETDDGVETDAQVDEGCFAEPTIVEIGTGDFVFEPLADGQMLRMVVGPQIGAHLTTSIRVRNTEALVRLRISVVDVATGRLVSQSGAVQELNVGLVPEGGGTWACSGGFNGCSAYLDQAGLDGLLETYPWDELCGREVTLRVDVHAEDGRFLASDERTLWVQNDDDVDPAASFYRPDCERVAP